MVEEPRVAHVDPSRAVAAAVGLLLADELELVGLEDEILIQHSALSTAAP